MGWGTEGGRPRRLDDQLGLTTVTVMACYSAGIQSKTSRGTGMGPARGRPGTAATAPLVTPRHAILQ